MTELYGASPRRWPWLALMGAGLAAMLFAILTVTNVWWQIDGSRAGAQDKAHQMVNNLHHQWATTTAKQVDSAPGVDGTPFATIQIPKFGSDYDQPIVQGTSLSELGIGVGHAPGTQMPGQVGNFAVAGHRTVAGRPFNRITELRSGDQVIVTTDTDTYVYKVVSHETVTPDQTQVYAPVPDHPGAKPTKAYLTMSACTPMYSASHRYVVHAVLVSSHNNG